MAQTETKTAAPLVNPYTYCRNCGNSIDMRDPNLTPAGTARCCSSDCFEIVAAADFVRLNSNPEHTERRTVIVTNENGRRFCARLVLAGDRYGAIGHRVGQRDLQPNELCRVNDGDPLIEWYAEQDDHSGFTPLGQHTGGTYNVETMASHYAGPHRGLNLHGGIPEWNVCADAFAYAYSTLVVEQGLDPAFVQGNNRRWVRFERIDHAAALPWFRPERWDRRNSAGSLCNLGVYQVATALDELGAANCGGTLMTIDELTTDDRVKIAILTRWGMVWTDHLTGQIELSTLGRLWSGWAFGLTDPTKWIDDEIEVLRDMVIDAIDAPGPDRRNGNEVNQSILTFQGRKRSLDSAKAFRCHLIVEAARAKNAKVAGPAFRKGDGTVG